MTVLCTAAIAAPASATQVTLAGDELSVSGGSERNVIDVERIGLDWEVTDVVPVTPGPGCVFASPNRARCSGNVFRVAIDAGPGNDLVAVWDAAVPTRIAGGPGDDLLEGSAGPDLLDGGPGLDAVVGGKGADLLLGSAGDDLLQGGAGADELRSGAGADIVQGGAGDDDLAGGLQRDLLTGGPGADVLGGGAGRDALVVDSRDELQTARHDTVYGDPASAAVPCGASAQEEPAPTPTATPAPTPAPTIHKETNCSNASECIGPSGRRCKARKPPRSWPPRKRASRSTASAAALRKPIRTYATLRSSGRARAVTIRVASIASFKADVAYTTFDDRGRSLKRQRARVMTRFAQTVARPAPPTAATSVKARCSCP